MLRVRDLRKNGVLILYFHNWQLDVLVMPTGEGKDVACLYIFELFSVRVGT